VQFSGTQLQNILRLTEAPIEIRNNFGFASRTLQSCEVPRALNIEKYVGIGNSRRIRYLRPLNEDDTRSFPIRTGRTTQPLKIGIPVDRRVRIEHSGMTTESISVPRVSNYHARPVQPPIAGVPQARPVTPPANMRIQIEVPAYPRNPLPFSVVQMPAHVAEQRDASVLRLVLPDQTTPGKLICRPNPSA
jgi:hypothetical protein